MEGQREWTTRTENHREGERETGSVGERGRRKGCQCKEIEATQAYMKAGRDRHRQRGRGGTPRKDIKGIWMETPSEKQTEPGQ